MVEGHARHARGLKPRSSDRGVGSLAFGDAVGQSKTRFYRKDAENAEIPILILTRCQIETNYPRPSRNVLDAVDIGG